MGIRNSDELKDWLEKLQIIKDDKYINNKQTQTMKNHVITRHIQLLKDTKSLKKIREKVNENEVIFAEQEDETTYRFEITPIFMADSPLLLITFENITQYQKSSKKKNEKLKLCTMMFENLKYISFKLEQTIHAFINQKVNPKINEIQKISSCFMNQLLIFVNIPNEIPLQKFKFKDIFNPIQNLFCNYQYQIEENVSEVSLNSNVLIFKYIFMSLFSCFEQTKCVKVFLKNIHSKYILVEVQTSGQFQFDLLKKMNQSSNDFTGRQQISLFQKYVQKIGPQEVQIMFNSETNITQIFLSLYINLEEKSLEMSQNWYNFINKTQQILVSPLKYDNFNGDILNGINSINHSYLSTLSQFFLNDKTTQYSQNTPKIRKISLQNNIRKFSKENQRKRNSSFSLQSPKNEIIEQYTKMYPIVQENNLSEIKSIASQSNLNDQDQIKFTSFANSLNSSKNIGFNMKMPSETTNNPKSLFSNRCLQIQPDIENGIIVANISSPQAQSHQQDFIDLLNNQSSPKQYQTKNSFLTLSCKSQSDNQCFYSKQQPEDQICYFQSNVDQQTFTSKSQGFYECNCNELLRNQVFKQQIIYKGSQTHQEIINQNSQNQVSKQNFISQPELSNQNIGFKRLQEGYQNNMVQLQQFENQQSNIYQNGKIKFSNQEILSNKYEFRTNGIQQNIKKLDIENNNDHENQSLPHFQVESSQNIQNGKQKQLGLSNYDNNYASTSSITNITQKLNDESMNFCNSGNNSIVQFMGENQNQYQQYKMSNINFEDKNKFQQIKIK